MNTKAILNIEGLSIQFGNDEPVLQDLSLKIHPSETLGLVGESGSGKSLTALAIMGLLSSKSQVKGSIVLRSPDEDVDVLSASNARLRQLRKQHLAMVFQEPMSALNPVMRCGAQVAEGLNDLSRDSVIRVFREVKLPDPERVYSAYPHQLSGGQRQRVMIAMTLLRKPLLMICDEPTTALDPTVQREILILLKDLQAKYGMGLLFISHDLGVVQHLTHRLHVLRKGETVETGRTTEVFEYPQANYTRALIHSRPSMYPNAERLPSPDDMQSLEWKPKLRTIRSAKTQTLLEVKELSFLYPGTSKRVLEGVDFTLTKGRTLGLVGESGSGKSTIGRLICGLLNGQGEQILLEGKPLNNIRSRDERRRIQMVFQDPFASLNPRYTVYRTISEAIRFHGIERQKAQLKERVVEILERTGLEAGMMNRYPHEFSGGQRQRIVMARALVLRPDVLICDESVAALDVSVQSRILNLLKDLQDEFGFSCLFISHDMSVIRFISDDVAVLNKGRIVEHGPVSTVFDAPKDAYTRRLLDAVMG